MDVYYMVVRHAKDVRKLTTSLRSTSRRAKDVTQVEKLLFFEPLCKHLP